MSEYSTEISEFKGNKIIALLKGEKRIFSFGLGKAKAILACIDKIKEFVENQDEK